jgi:hypothetical protein
VSCQNHCKMYCFEVIENFGFVASRHLKLFLLLCHVKTLFYVTSKLMSCDFHPKKRKKKKKSFYTPNGTSILIKAYDCKRCCFEVIENFGFVTSRHLKLFLLLCHVKTLFFSHFIAYDFSVTSKLMSWNFHRKKKKKKKKNQFSYTK